MKRVTKIGELMEIVEGTPEEIRAYDAGSPFQPGLRIDVTRTEFSDGRVCVFDSLPPGVYGLVCTCPNCTVQCTVT